MDDALIDTIARAYHDAERDRRRNRPPSAQYDGFTIEDAYAVQRRWVEIKVAKGNVVKGHKIGLTSAAMQRQAIIDEPDYGTLMADMFYQNGADIPTARFIEPLLECEIGFVLGRPLRGPGCTIFDVLNATDYVVPAVEIVDRRTERVDPVTGRRRCVLDSIADNAGNAALVIGGRPIRPTDTDLRWIGALCYRNNTIEESGIAAAVLDHPANGIAWLANKLAPFGVSLDPGHFFLSGSFTGVVPARAGDVFHVDYGPLGSVVCRFE